jgi:hypothetical protein
MTAKNGFSGATELQKFSSRCNGVAQEFVSSLLHTRVLQKPFSHLLNKLNLVLFVQRPAHVENIRHGFPVHNVLHQIFASMEGVSTGKVIFRPRKNFDFHSVHAGVLLQQSHQRDLVTVRGQDQIARQQKAVEKVPRPLIGANIVKARIGRIRRIVHGVVAAAGGKGKRRRNQKAAS